MTFEEAYLQKYPKNRYVLNRMYEFAGSPEWNKFDKPYLAGLTRYFRNVMSDSSARTALGTVKATLNDYKELVSLPERFEKVLRVRATNSVETWLTEDELSLLEDYNGNENEMSVLRDFLIGAWTGARHSDFSQLDTHNIVNGMLTYVSEKSKTKATIPIKPLVRRLLHYDRTTVDESTANRIIKRICQNVGIANRIRLFRRGESVTDEKWKFVSSHTARRSFATNLYLRGVDILTISRFMGHSSIEMTKRYIVCEMKDLSKEEIEFFG